MGSLIVELEQDVRATSVRVTDDSITVELDDGRNVSVPTAWYPRLLHANRAERNKYEIDDVGVSWPAVEADFSIRGILLGKKSGESRESLKFWLDARKTGKKVTVIDFLKARKAARARKIASGTKQGRGPGKDTETVSRTL